MYQLCTKSINSVVCSYTGLYARKSVPDHTCIPTLVYKYKSVLVLFSPTKTEIKTFVNENIDFLSTKTKTKTKSELQTKTKRKPKFNG